MRSPNFLSEQKTTENVVDPSAIPYSPSPSHDGNSRNMQLPEDDRSQMSHQASRKSFGKASTAIQRSNASFKLEGREAGELKIENDRLQTTIMILNQKLKSQNDSEGQIAQLRKKMKDMVEEKMSGSKDNLSLK